MAKISLRAYDREIEDLIERGYHPEEVIAHCHHILKTFPKHLATYRLLGKAYLEAKRYGDAVDIFQRVLLAAPEDFVAHVGMSIIADDQGKLDDAIWHMERAFEVQPSNAAIQGELQRLFGRRDGVEPPRIRLTRGALAHMYVRGDLNTQAVSEIRSVLDQDPKRADMQVLLAKAHFRSGQKTEAANVCTGLLTSYPYCLDANRLMVELLSGTERVNSAQEYRQRLIELDPYLGFAPDSASDSEHVADTAVTLERLQEASATEGAGAALGIGLAADAAATGLDADQSSWLASVTGGAANAPSPGQTKGDIPGFLRQRRWTATGEGTQESSEQVGAESQSEQDVVSGSLPDWVKALAPADETAPDRPQVSKDELPEWLRSFGQVESSGARPVAAGDSQSEPPLWLQGLGDRQPGPVLQTEAKAIERAEASGMLANEHVATPGSLGEEAAGGIKDVDARIETPAQAQVRAENTAHPNLDSLSSSSMGEDTFLADPNTGSEVVPDSVDNTAKMREPAPDAVDSFESTSVAQATVSDSDPSAGSLRHAGLSHEASVSRMASPISGAQPRPSERDGFAGTETEGEQEGLPIVGEHEASGWLSDLGPGVAKSPPIDEAPAWLNADASIAPHEGSGTDAVRLSESASEMDLPDWLAGLDEQESGSSTEDGQYDGLPEWLHPESQAEAPRAEPTRTADWQPAETAESFEAVTSGKTTYVDQHGVSEEAAAASGPSNAAAKSSAFASVPPGLKAGPAIVSGVGEVSMGDAKSELGRGNIPAALDIYGKLIRKGRSLEEIIRDLRDALYRYPVEVPIWQALGDAYMRANRLQEALDAYTKGEELLR